jgi:PKD repeat protein
MHLSRMKLSFSLLLAALLFPTILHAQAPVAAFTANNTTGCAPFPLVVNFTDQSTNSPTSWLWTFGDPNGSSSTLQNPAFVYSDPGCYTVTLTATNASGNNTVVQTCFVEIYPQPDPGFNVDLAEGCAPLTVTFSDASVPNAASLTNWNWTLASNNIPLSGSSPTYTFTTPDTTGVILTVTNSNGCQNTIVVPDVVAILEPPLADFSVDVNSACTPPLTVNFSNLSTTNGASNPTYTWLFPGGQTPGGLSSFTGSVPPPVTYNANGQYDVTLILESTNECADTITYTSLIGIGGVNADFTVSDTLICVGDPLVFTNTSTGGATSIEWEVDGQPGVDGTANTLNYVYNTAGVYTITLRANNTQCGDTLTRVNHVTVFDRPTSSFSVDKLVDCQPGLPFTFTDLSMGAANWSWDFGDGNTSNLPNPVHTYANFGSYNACLTVTNADGCTDVFCETINIAPANAAISFNPDEGCAPTTVNFSDNSQTSGDPVISWDWDFFSANATPSTATVQNPSVTYSAAGLYDVQLIITTQGGCTDTVFVNNAIEIGDPPQLDFTVDKDTVCINEDITFSSTFTDPNWQYFWDFQYQDPGNFSLNNDTAMTVYADTGFFDVGLIILSQGCRDTLIIDSMVYVSPPDARFFPSDIAVCFPPQTISFADSSIGPIDVYEWYVNGVFYSDQPTPPDLALNAVGSYLVTQIVTDTLTGCTDTADVVVSAGGPVADFDVTDTVGCRPFPVPVNNNSQNATIFQTYFGFGASPLVGISNSPNPARTFPDTGSYSIQMIARDNLGCADTLTRTNYISVLGTYPDFSNTPVLGCRPLPVDFTDLSQSSSLSNIVSWDWDFGDGIGSSTLQNPTYVYPNTGTYDVSLATTDDAGCVDTVVIPDAVKVTFPAPDFIVDDDSSCAGADLVFTSISNGFNPMTFSWNFGDGNTGTGSPVTHAYADTGFYDVTLIVTDGNGCVDSITYNDLVYIEPFEANFSGDPNIGVCPPLTTAFTDSTIGNVVGWDWDFGTGINTSNLQNPQNVYFLPGNFTVSLIATHEDGCQDTVTKVDYVQLNGPNGSFSLNPPNACLGDTVCIEAVLLGTDIGIVDWKNGSTSVLQGLSGVVDTVSVCQVYNNPGKYFPQIVVTDNNGCSVTLNSPDSTQVYVLPQAQIMPVDSAGCLPFNLPFVDASLAGDTLIDTWTWLFGDGDTSFVQNPDHTYQAESIFTVTLAIEDANGCVDTTTTTVTTYEGTIGSFRLLTRSAVLLSPLISRMPVPICLLPTGPGSLAMGIL